MPAKLLTAWALMALCVVIHAVGVAAALRWVRREATIARGLWPSTRLFVRVAGMDVLLHLFEIAVWAFFYAWRGAMRDWASALYFSAVTYTTTGYGDLVLPPEWRLLGAVEALTGILMCGWSTGFFVAVVSRSFRAHEAEPANRTGDSA